jgi:hypothetical protein
MKLKQNHKAILKRLSNGPRTELELTTGEVDQTAHAQHTIRYLLATQAFGLCVKIGDAWSLTNSGRAAIEDKEVEKATKRICAYSVTERYDGKELRQLGNRVGAYDFLSIPSRFFDARVYRPDAKVL